MDNTFPKAEIRRAREILSILRSTLDIRVNDFATLTVAKESKDPFRTLVVTVLTQNCTDVAALRAYRNLDEQVGVSPPRLARASIRTIERAIRVAGLYKQKARGLKRLAQAIVEQYEGDFGKALRGPLDKVRVTLQELPRVGPKTADVVLGVWGRPTISVDTHVDRVSKRLGLAPEKGGYDKVRDALMQLFPKRDRRMVPLYFMAHGRRTCKAPTPLCPVCPVEKLCAYEFKTRRR